MYQDLLSGDDQEIVDSTVDKHLNVKMKMCSKRRKDIVEPIKFNQILKHNSVCEICQQDVGASIENIPTIPRSSDPIPTEDAQLRNSKSAPSLPLIKTKYNTKSSGSSNKNAKDSGSNTHSRKTSLKTMKAEGLGSATSLPSILSKYKHIGKRFDTNSISLADSYLKTIRDANKFSADTHNNIAERGFDATEATVPPNNLRKQTKTRIKRLTVAECSYCSVVAHIHCLPKSIADSIFNSMNVESDLDANQGSTRSNFGYEWTCDSCIESQQHSLRYLQKKLDLEELKRRRDNAQIKIASTYRMYVEYSEYRRVYSKIVHIQTIFRNKRVRLIYKRLKQSLLKPLFMDVTQCLCLPKCVLYTKDMLSDKRHKARPLTRQVVPTHPYVIITILDEDVMKVSGQMRRKLGTNAKPSQQYWYHETWCGQPIETDETDEAQALSEDIQSSSKPLLEQTSNFQYDINKSNSGVVFGGVSGRQIVVFSVMHATDSSSSADSVSTVPEKEQHDHSGMAHVPVPTAQSPPLLLGQAAMYLHHCRDGFSGSIPLEDKDEYPIFDPALNDGYTLLPYHTRTLPQRHREFINIHIKPQAGIGSFCGHVLTSSLEDYCKLLRKLPIMPAGVYASVSHATLLGMSHSDIVHHCSLKLANHQSMHAHHSSVDKKKNHHKEVMLAAAAARHTSFDNFIPSIVPLPKSKTVNNTMANSSVVSVILHQASVLPLKKCWMAIADNYIYFYRRFGELPRLILDTKQCDLTFSTSEPDCPERVMEAAMKRLLSKNPHSTAAPKPILKKVSFIVSTTTADVSFEPEGESDNESVETVSSPVKAKLMEKKQSGVNNSNRASSNGNGAGNDNPRKRSVGSVVSSVAGGNSISSSAKSNKSKSPTKSVHHHVIPSIYDNVVIAPLTIGVLGATDTFRLCSAMMATFRKFSTLQVKSDLIASELQKTLNLIHRYQSEFVSCNSELNALKHKHNTGISEITHQSKANHVLQHQFHAEEKLFFRQRDLLNGKIANYKAMIAMETENLQSLVNTGSRFLKIHRALISRSVAMLDSHNMLPMLQHHDIVLDASVNSIRDERRAGVAQIIDVNLINHMAIEKDLQQITEFKKKQESDEENHKNQESVALGSNVETTMGVLKVVTKFMKVVAGKRKIEAAIAASVAADKAAAAEEAQVEKMKLLGLTQSSGIPRRTSKPEGREAEMNTKKDTKRIIAPKAEKSTTSDKVQVFGLRQAASQLVRQLSYYFDINIYMSDLLKYPIQVPIPGSKAQYRELINAGHKPISALVHSSRHAVKKPKKNGGKRNKKKGGRGKTEGDTSSVVSKNNSLQSGTTAIRHILSGKNTKPGQPDSKNSLNSKIPKKTYFKDANITTIVELINSRNNSRAASRAATRDGAVTDDVPLSIDTSLFHSNDIKGDGSESDASISSYSDTESNDSGETRKHGVMVHQYESASKSRYKSRSKVKLEKFK